MGHDPLFPGLPPVLTRVLAVGGDTTRLHRLVTNLRLLGYQVTISTDPAAAMAVLRQGGGPQGLSFEVVMVDRSSQYPSGRRAAALELFQFAVREPQLCAYGIKEEETYGPLAMEDLNKFRKAIYNVEPNGPKSQEATPNSLYNTLPSTTVSTITNLPFSGRREGLRSKKHTSDTDSQEVDGEHAEKEQQQPSQKPKKARVVWTDELHKKFVAAYNKLPLGAAVPKKILELMNDPTLTRENIASHLQKYRLNLESEDNLRRSHSRTKHHRSTPQASFPSHNMPQKQAPPTIMQSTMDKSNNYMLVDVPPKGMYPRDDDPKQNSACCVGNSDENSPQEDDISVILNKDPEPSWDEEFLSNGD